MEVGALLLVTFVIICCLAAIAWFRRRRAGWDGEEAPPEKLTETTQESKEEEDSGAAPTEEVPTDTEEDVPPPSSGEAGAEPGKKVPSSETDEKEDTSGTDGEGQAAPGAAGGPPSEGPDSGDGDGPRSEGGKGPVIRTVKKKRSPIKRGGRPRGPTSGGGAHHANETQKRLPHPDIVCWEDGRHWIVGVEVPEQLETVAVTQAGESLKPSRDDKTLYPLLNLSGSVTIRSAAVEDTIDLGDDADTCFVFRTRMNWQGTGRLVNRCGVGHYVIVAPETWSRDEGASGPAPVEEEKLHIDGYRVHFFWIEDAGSKAPTFTNESGDSISVESRGNRFELAGRNRAPDARRDIGPLFCKEPPSIRSIEPDGWDNIATIVVGEEGPGSKKWRDQFSPEKAKQRQTLPESLARRRGGWYFVRIYDKEDNLVESMDFRFLAALKEIRLPHVACLPPDNGHQPGTVCFCHDPECEVRMQNAAADSLDVERLPERTRVTIPAKPEWDATDWEISHGDVTIRSRLLMERVWWAVNEEHKEPADSDWGCTPLALCRSDFAASSNRAIWLRLPRSSWVKSVAVGFAQLRPYRVDRNRRTLVIPLRDFADALQPGCSDALQVQVRPHDGEYLCPVATVTSVYRCKLCDFAVEHLAPMRRHIEESHLDDLFTPLTYDELRARLPDLPSAVYKCAFCGFYVASDDPENPTSVIVKHLKEACEAAPVVRGLPILRFVVVKDVDEIRENVVAALPRIERCKKCGYETNDGQPLEKRCHFEERHPGALYAVE